MKSHIIYMVFLLTTLMSCKKNYTCDCSYTYDWGDGTTTEQEYSFDILKSKKNDAESECSTYAEDQSNWRYTYQCELNSK